MFRVHLEMRPLTSVHNVFSSNKHSIACRYSSVMTACHQSALSDASWIWTFSVGNECWAVSEWSWVNVVATALNTSCFPFLLNRVFSTRTPTAILRSSTATVTNPRTCKLSSHDIRGRWMSSPLCTGHCCSQESWIFCGERGYFFLSFPFIFWQTAVIAEGLLSIARGVCALKTNPVLHFHRRSFWFDGTKGDIRLEWQQRDQVVLRRGEAEDAVCDSFYGVPPRTFSCQLAGMTLTLPVEPWAVDCDM